MSSVIIRASYSQVAFDCVALDIHGQYPSLNVATQQNIPGQPRLTSWAGYKRKRPTLFPRYFLCVLFSSAFQGFGAPRLPPRLVRGQSMRQRWRDTGAQTSGLGELPLAW